tara:strand:- start:136050 stop:136448 length:399 start_codon:yes stop_codon:yes gene_type:complete
MECLFARFRRKSFILKNVRWNREGLFLIESSSLATRIKKSLVFLLIHKLLFSGPRLGLGGDLPFTRFSLKDIKKASAVLAVRFAPAVELVFLMSLRENLVKGRPSLNRWSAEKKFVAQKKNAPKPQPFLLGK